MKRPNDTGPAAPEHPGHGGPATGIARTLKEDHAAIRVLLQQIEESSKEGLAGPWSRLFQIARAELLAYSRARRDVLYPSLRSRDQLIGAHDERRLDEIEQLIEGLRVPEPDAPHWQKLLRELSGTVDAHVRFEEQNVMAALSERFPAEEREPLDRAFRRRRAEVREQYSSP